MQFHPKDLSELDELTEEHLGFSALSDGLGFTRNSKAIPSRQRENIDLDPGLKKKALSGTGAVAAGPVLPAPERKRAPIATSKQSAATVLSEPAAPRFLRLAAFLIDIGFVLLPLIGAWWFSFGSLSWEIFLENRQYPVALFGLILGVYFLLSESFGGQSLGKMALGLRVVEDDKYQKPTGLGHAVQRLALLAVGGALIGLGLFASFWDAKRRPWHDRFSGSIVRKQA